MEIKTQIRTEFKQIRNEIDSLEREKMDIEICNHIFESLLFQKVETIYLFYPLGSEVSLLKLFAKAKEMGKTIGFPKVLGNEMEFYSICKLSDLKEGSFHVMEPDFDKIDSKACLLKVQNPLILTPGLVFDRQGNRYGYGAGFYDKYFQRYPKANRVGVAYDVQISKSLQADEFDIPMQHLYTQSGALF